MNREITKAAEKRRGRRSTAEEGVWMPLPPQPRRRQRWFDGISAVRDNRDAAMTAAAEERKGHLSDFSAPWNSDPGSSRGCWPWDKRCWLLWRLSKQDWAAAPCYGQHRGVFKINKRRMRHNSAEMGPGVTLNGSRKAWEAGKAGLS